MCGIMYIIHRLYKHIQPHIFMYILYCSFYPDLVLVNPVLLYSIEKIWEKAAIPKEFLVLSFELKCR